VVKILKIGDWMSKSVTTITKEKTVYEAAKLMDELNIGSLPVVEKGVPIGIVTERDIIRRAVAKDKDIHKTKINEIMTKDPVTVDDDTSILEVSRIMSEHNFRRVMVVKKGKLLGIVTAKDIINITST